MSLHILIVDDDPLMRTLLEHHLERAGYSVTLAATGREGLKAAFCKLPHIIILDIMMQEMDGFTVVRELKNIPATRTIPIIIMTARVDVLETLRDECARLGVDVFLTKPFDPALLLSEVKRLTGHANDPEQP